MSKGAVCVGIVALCCGSGGCIVDVAGLIPLYPVLVDVMRWCVECCCMLRKQCLMIGEYISVTKRRERETRKVFCLTAPGCAAASNGRPTGHALQAYVQRPQQ